LLYSAEGLEAPYDEADKPKWIEQEESHTMPLWRLLASKARDLSLCPSVSQICLELASVQIRLSIDMQRARFGYNFVVLFAIIFCAYNADAIHNLYAGAK
jgi:hypothetical protein